MKCFAPIVLIVFLLLPTAPLPAVQLTQAQINQLPPPAAGPIHFAQDIQPILEASCIKCHGRGRNKGEFKIDTRQTVLKGGESGPAVVPGKSQESHLIALVAGADPDEVMPQKGKRLTAEQVGLLRAWIDQGLPWDENITFAKPPPANLVPRKPDLPPASGDLQNPIDRLLQPYLAAHQVVPPSLVSDRVYARRVYLDLIGLLPNADELESFIRDPSPDKRSRLVERLLADRDRYAQHWLTFWNDALRNDYRGTGYIDGGRKQITTWLYSALADNLPYDQFVARLIDPTPETEGFTKGIVWRGVVNASQTPQMQAAQNISQVFMGINLKCASCHDSFINDWTLADSYGLAAIYADGPLEMVRCDRPTGKTAPMKFLFPELGEIDPNTSRTNRLHHLADIVTSRKNGRLSRTVVNRLWARFFGRGLVEPVDDMDQPAWAPDVLDWLAEDLVEHHYNLKATMARIVTSRAYQWPAVDAGETASTDYVFNGPVVRRMSAEQFRDALGQLTGVWYSAPAAAIVLDGGGPKPASPQARWIWNDPSAAQKAAAGTVYFRKNITLPAAPSSAFMVVTCDNSYTLYVNDKKAGSGKDYGRPDYIDLARFLHEGANTLAVEAINHLPNNKPPSPGQPATDADANPAGLFLQGDVICPNPAGQDSRLSLLSDTSWRSSTSADEHWQETAFADSDWTAAADLGDAAAAPWKLGDRIANALAIANLHGQTRASLANADPLTRALGRPNREQVMTHRASTATTLQALELTNGATLASILEEGAEKLIAEKPATEDLVSHLFVTALGRKPASDEMQLAESLVGDPVRKEGLEDFLWSLAMLPEFQLIY